MKQLVERRLGKLSPEETPSLAYLIAKSEETGQNEPRAATLDVMSSDGGGEDYAIGESLDLHGRFRVTRKRNKVTLPRNPEEYVRHMRVEANAWLSSQCGAHTALGWMD